MKAHICVSLLLVLMIPGLQGLEMKDVPADKRRHLGSRMFGPKAVAWIVWENNDTKIMFVPRSAELINPSTGQKAINRWPAIDLIRKSCEQDKHRIMDMNITANGSRYYVFVRTRAPGSTVDKHHMFDQAGALAQIKTGLTDDEVDEIVLGQRRPRPSP